MTDKSDISSYIKKEKKIAVIGLGYVGLPIALEFAKKYSVIGFDINAERVALMQNKIDPSKELVSSDFDNTDIQFTANIEDLKAASFYIVAVPTPVDDHKVPDLIPVTSASKTVGQVIKKGDCVVFESTVYPGCTEEDCIPIIEELSGLKAYDDFKFGYSPERINPGDKEHTLTKITKIVAGCDHDALDLIAAIYGSIIEVGVYKAASVKVAEAAKVIENTQRDLNIALMNELSQIFNKMDINTFDVLAAAGTKWNFLKFFPGLVGGHCIGVDPYYLTYKSNQLGYEPKIILSGRSINDGMSAYVAKKMVQYWLSIGKNPASCKALILGATFKENVSDIRNSKIFDLYKELQDYNVAVTITDPLASKEEVLHEYQVELSETTNGKYDAIIISVAHQQYISLEEEYFINLANENCIIADLKNIYQGKINQLKYWTL